MSLERALRKSTLDAAFLAVRVAADLELSLDDAIEVASARQAGHDYNSALWLIAECGLSISSLPTSWDKFYRFVSFEVIQKYRPFWLSAVRVGRMALIGAVPRDQYQCLVDSGLLEKPPSAEVLQFWNSLVSLAYYEQDMVRLRNGTEAEVLALAEERRLLAIAGRPDLEPIWVSLDDSNRGYDIESYLVRDGDTEKRYLEIKGFVGGEISFHISRAEWKAAARLQERYIVQVWSLDARLKVLELRAEELALHIPVDNGSGRWESVLIRLNKADASSTRVSDVRQSDQVPAESSNLTST